MVLENIQKWSLSHGAVSDENCQWLSTNAITNKATSAEPFSATNIITKKISFSALCWSLRTQTIPDWACG